MKKSPLKQLAHRLEYGILLCFGTIFRMMPPRMVYSIARALGLFAYHVVRIRRDVALQNLRQSFGNALPEEQLERIAGEAYVNIGMTFIEMLLAPGIAGRVSGVVDDSEIDVLGRAFARGKGVILVSGHFGSWELAGALIGEAGFPVTVVGKRQSNPYVDDWVQRTRSKFNMRVIQPGAPIKLLIRALRKGECIGLISDQDAGSRGVFVNFFGRPASTTRGAAELALKYRAPVIATMAVRTGPGRYHSIFREVEVLDGDTVKTLTQRYTAVLERVIAEHPEQYFWMHRRWKTAPGMSAPVDKTTKTIPDENSGGVS